MNYVGQILGGVVVAAAVSQVSVDTKPAVSEVLYGASASATFAPAGGDAAAATIYDEVINDDVTTETIPGHWLGRAGVSDWGSY